MSLEQKATVLFFIFWLSFFISTIILKVLFIIICCWYLRKELSLLLLLILFICVVWNTTSESKKNVQFPYCGIVVNFSDNYILLKHKNTQLAMFTDLDVNYNDKLCVQGKLEPISFNKNFFKDPISTWQIASNHLGIIKPTHVEKMNNRLAFKGALYEQLKQATNTEWMIILLFTRKLASNSLLLSLLFSSGLQFSYALRWIKKGLSKILIQEHVRIVLVMFWILFKIVWGTSFVWWRVFFMVVCMQFISNKKLGLVIGYSVLLMMFPTMYAHLSFVFPMLLQMIYFHQKPSVIQRFFMIAVLQHMMLYASNLVLILGFSLFRHFSGLAYLGAWTLVILPFLRKPFNQTMDAIMSYSSPGLVSIAGKLPFFLGLFLLMLILSKSFNTKRHHFFLGICITTCVSLWMYPPYDLVLFFNVGQADAALIRTRFNQETLMIDVGKKSNIPLIRQSLKALGINHLDAVLLSHLDDDHAGGLEALIQQIPVDYVGINKQNYVFNTLDFIGLNKTYQGKDHNDNSLVGVIEVGGLRYLFLGDIYEQGETKMIQEYPNLQVDVLKVAHHGSKTSTSNNLLALTKPRFGVISSDPTVYGHPHDIVLKSLFNYKVLPLLTYEEGDIAFVRIFNIDFVITSMGRFGIIR